METKMKIVLVLFVVVLLAYAIYYVMSDVNKQKASEQKDKRIIETFEEYDIRKQILGQLDKFKIDSKTKTKIFDSLSGKIDTYKNMTPADMKDMINEGIKELEKRYGVAKTKEAYVEQDEEPEEQPPEDVEETYEDKDPSLDSISKAFKSKRETFAKEDTFDEPAPIKRPKEQHNSDIADILDNTSASLETVQRNLTKLKNILVAANPPPKATAAKPKTTIEGFENLSSNSYASYF